MPIPVDVDGRLTLVDPQARCIAVIGHGSAVEIGFPDLGSARQAYAAFTGRTDGNRAVGLLQRELQRGDLALQFSVRGVTVGHLSGSSQGSAISRAMRLGGVDLRLGGMLRALMRW
jgi:hypothetical protein